MSMFFFNDFTFSIWSAGGVNAPINAAMPPTKAERKKKT